MTNQRYNRWTVLRDGLTHKGSPALLCRCDCGTERVVDRGNMRQGLSKSCGCLHKERVRDFNAATKTKHGICGSPTYYSWRSMKQRCLDKVDGEYANKRYGGLGVCEKWMTFEGFLEDMGERPEGTTLERIDNAKGYEPSNCKWASRLDQNRNRGVTVWVEYKGRKTTIFDLARETGLTYGLLMDRIKRYGWSPERAVETPNRLGR